MRTVAKMAIAVAMAMGCTTGGSVDLPDAQFDPLTPQDAGVVLADGEVLPDTCAPGAEGSTIGQACSTNADCDDGCYCNGQEVCGDGFTCETGGNPCTDDIECTVHTCDEPTDSCNVVAMNEMCSDGVACNGEEICDTRNGCVTGAPLYCNDEDSCTVDSCDDAEGCVYAVRDLDGDTFTDGRCGGEDCDDDPRFGVEIFPGATEDCQNRRDDNCDGLRDYNDPTCIPTNDVCGGATVLPGPGTYSGSTRSLTADYVLGCMASGPDAVFVFTVDPETQFPGEGYEALDVRATIAGGGSSVGLALRPLDGDAEGDLLGCSAGEDLKCANGSAASFLRRSLPSGNYAIIVKTSTGNPFDLNLQFSEPTPIPPVDVCDGGTTDISAGGTFAGNYEEVDDDYGLTCHTSSTTAWRDAAYTFTIDEAQDVTINASSVSSGSSFTTTYLQLVRDSDPVGDRGGSCGVDDDVISCVSGSAPEIYRRGLEAGTYYVLVEASRADAVTWSLDIDITDVVPRSTGDACETAVDISESTLGGGGSGSLDLSTLERDFGTSCGGTSTSYRDASFFFTLDRVRDVTLSTTAGSGSSWHYTSIGTECGVFGSDLRCTSGSSPVNTFRSLPAGTYYVSVSTSTSTGTIAASITTSEPTPIPPNDRCDGAIDISVPGVYDGTTVDFEDDIVGCSGSGRPDAFYRFTLATRSLATVVASPISGTSSISLTLQDSCDAASMERACDTGNPSAFSEVLEPGDYTVIVETYSSSETDIRLQSVFTPID